MKQKKQIVLMIKLFIYSREALCLVLKENKFRVFLTDLLSFTEAFSYVYFKNLFLKIVFLSCIFIQVR